MRLYARVWGTVSNPQGFGIRNASGQAVLPSGEPPGAQRGAGAPKSLWVVVQTDANGNNDLVYVTALCQCLLLNLNESPFFAANGIPAHQSVMQQVPPDYYVALTQQQFAQYFASLQISRVNANPPTYSIVIVTHQGVKLNVSVPIPI